MREITVRGTETVAELAASLRVANVDVIEIGFRDLGLLLTIHQQLSLAQIRSVANAFGFSVRMRENG